MIASKTDLKEYLLADKKALQIPETKKFPTPLYDEVWRFQIALRKAEYAVNCRKGLFYLPYRLYRKVLFHLNSVRCGFSLPLNVFGKGLSIAHYGTIVVNANARIGEYCRIQECVTIGSSGDDLAPQIGDYVFIGSGARIMGNVHISDGVSIGAGAVVVKSIIEKNISVAGVPARKISDKGSECVAKWMREIE